jgi:stage V sporulation protein S
LVGFLASFLEYKYNHMFLPSHPILPFCVPLISSQVSASSSPQVVAGALAARVREGAVPCLTAIGVDAVANCVLAIGHTRLYLEADGKDIRARPEFIHVLKNGADWNAIKFHIHVDTI